MTAAMSDYNRTGSCNPALAVVRHAPAAAAPVANLPGRVDSSSRGSVICLSGVSCCSEYRSRVMSLAASPIVARLLPAVYSPITAVPRQTDASLITIRTIIRAEPKGSEPNGFPGYVFPPERGRFPG